MRVDRAELAGTGAAILFHVLLIAALSLSLAHVVRPPETPPMEVEIVDQVGLKPTAPAPVAAPPAPSQAPEQAPEVTPAPPPPQPQPAPVPEVKPVPQPRVEPEKTPAPPKVSKPAPPKPAPPKTAPKPRPAPPTPKAAPEKARPAPAKSRPAPPSPARPHVSRIGADFLKGIADAPPSDAPARPAAATISASAMAGIQQAIRRQVQPCADRQVNPGPGASRIKVKLHLVLSRTGRLTSPPQVVGTSGVDDDNSRYEERVNDLAVSIISGCAPLTGLPPDLYKTSNGQGWGDFILNYNLP